RVWLLPTRRGTRRTGSLLVLDEPTVGLHPTDIPPLVSAMRELSAAGNAVLVIEHEPIVLSQWGRLVELRPGAGTAGGQITYDGPPKALGSAPPPRTRGGVGSGGSSKITI